MQEGLSNSQIIVLQKQYGPNRLPEHEKISAIGIFFEQFKSPLYLVLLVAAGISFYFHDYHDVWLILIVIFIDAIMGFIEEYKAQKTLKALKNILKPIAKVIRDGVRKSIQVEDLVPGDIVVIGSGDRVPADGQLVEGVNILINEAILTGESEAIEKNINDKANKLMMGTIVLSGSGLMKVEKTGVATEIGKIGKSLEAIQEGETPLEIKIKQFAKKLALIVIVLAIVVFITGIVSGKSEIWEMFRVSVVLAVAAIPAALPIAVTIIMAIGMNRILKKHGLVKRLSSIETLGSTTIICTDKTGTLTEGVMRVVKTDFIDKKYAHLTMILDNDQRSNLEISLIDYVKKQKINHKKIFDKYKRIYQEPFSSATKYSMSINTINDREIGFIKGAPDIVINYCKLNMTQKSKELKKIEQWASDGLRILALAYKDKGNLETLRTKNNYKWIGLIGIEDPLRPQVKGAINEAMRAGVNTKIVTGDYVGTAINIAHDIGLKFSKQNILEGKDIDKMGDIKLSKIIDDISIFARVTPIQKLRIVEILQNKGEIVAMTGDGVNDSPALKKSDIGVVIGQDASEVAKETGDLVLLNSNFKTIVSAIEEGRLVFSNIKKVIAYILSNSFAELILIFSTIMLGLPLPITVVQILWIQLVCDGPPDVLLGFEPQESDLLREKPQDVRYEQILDRKVKIIITTVSLATGLLALLIFDRFYTITGNLALAQTEVFVALGIVSMIYVFSFKSLKKSLTRTEHFWSNKYLLWGVLYGWILMIAAVYIPVLNNWLQTVPLTFAQWIPILGMGFIVTMVVEAVKYFSAKSYPSRILRTNKS